MTHKNSSILRLAVDNDRVWFGNDQNLATCSDNTIDEFMLTKIFSDARMVRIIGHLGNCELISKLYQAHLVAGLSEKVDVQVASPDMASHDNPAASLSAMWRASVDHSDMNCYWATLNSHDYVSFSMMAAVYKDGRVGDKALHASRYHPAWPAVSFIWKFDPIAAIKLLVDIGDPRWFQHPIRPGRLSRLYAYLGLNIANIRIMCGHSTVPGQNLQRAANVINVWRTGNDGYSEAKQPRAFLDRIEASHRDLDRGVLSSSQRLIRFIREVWLANRSEDPEVSFSAKQFFKNKDEVAAYSRHVKTGPSNSIDTIIGD